MSDIEAAKRWWVKGAQKRRHRLRLAKAVVKATGYEGFVVFTTLFTLLWWVIEWAIKSLVEHFG